MDFHGSLDIEIGGFERSCFDRLLVCGRYARMLRESERNSRMAAGIADGP